MNDDFDIDKFLNESFAKIEKKIDNKKAKKVEKLVNKHKNEDKKQIFTKLNINDFQFDNVISGKIFEEFNLPGMNKNIKLDNLLQPLFPNEKVYLNEFKNADKSFILDRYIGAPKDQKDENIISSKKEASTAIKINKFKKIKESSLIKSLKTDNTIKYSSLINMNVMWKDYITMLLNKTTAEDTIYSKMLKADLHGAIIEVIASSNKNLSGIIGINLLETRRSFNLLGSDDKLRTVLKKGSEFKIELPYGNFAVKILGNNFTYKAVERTKAKFKNKYYL